jgi:hypothetical protein
LATLNDDPVHDDTAVDVEQIPAGDDTNVDPAPAASFDNGVNV